MTPGTVGASLLISVAKRLVPLAVRRNLVKRIVREAWRAAVRNAASMKAPGRQSSEQETSSGSARQSLQSEQGKNRSGLGTHGETARVCLVRLKRNPGSDLTKARRILRADVDDLFAVFLSKPASSERSRPPGFSGSAHPRGAGA